MSDVQEQRVEKSSERYDVDAIREDFPILHQKVHDQPLVYLDNGHAVGMDGVHSRHHGVLAGLG